MGCMLILESFVGKGIALMINYVKPEFPNILSRHFEAVTVIKKIN